MIQELQDWIPKSIISQDCHENIILELQFPLAGARRGFHCSWANQFPDFPPAPNTYPQEQVTDKNKQDEARAQVENTTEFRGEATFTEKPVQM